MKILSEHQSQWQVAKLIPLELEKCEKSEKKYFQDYTKAHLQTYYQSSEPLITESRKARY